MNILKICGVALIAAFSVGILKIYKSEFVLPVSVVSSVVLLGAALATAAGGAVSLIIGAVYTRGQFSIRLMKIPARDLRKVVALSLPNTITTVINCVIMFMGFKMGSIPLTREADTGEAYRIPVTKNIYAMPSWKTPIAMAHSTMVWLNWVSRTREGKPITPPNT